MAGSYKLVVAVRIPLCALLSPGSQGTLPKHMGMDMVAWCLQTLPLLVPRSPWGMKGQTGKGPGPPSSSMPCWYQKGRGSQETPFGEGTGES